jgi:hypothetical protein
MEIGESLERRIYESAQKLVWFPVDDLMDELVRDANGKSYVEDLVSTFVWDLVVDSVSIYDSVFMSVEHLDNEID